ncbi:MAG: hypothetical protein ACOYK1_05055 [Vampirovibrionia bacterium]
MPDYKKVNEYRIEIIKSLGFWLISPTGLVVYMFLFNDTKLFQEMNLIKATIALLLLVSGIKCLDKAYEINKELDKELDKEESYNV